MARDRDGYQVCIGDGVISVNALSEAQAKECLCRYIDKLESIESDYLFSQRKLEKWRGIKAPRLTR